METLEERLQWLERRVGLAEGGDGDGADDQTLAEAVEQLQGEYAAALDAQPTLRTLLDRLRALDREEKLWREEQPSVEGRMAVALNARQSLQQVCALSADLLRLQSFLSPPNHVGEAALQGEDLDDVLTVQRVAVAALVQEVEKTVANYAQLTEAVNGRLEDISAQLGVLEAQVASS